MENVNDTEIGSYTCTQVGNVAYFTFLRTDEKARFSLKQCLEEVKLKKAGKFSVDTQYYYIEAEETQIISLYKNFFHKCWLAALDKPLSQVIKRWAKVRLEGPQGELPAGAKFDFAFTKIAVPVKEV